MVVPLPDIFSAIALKALAYRERLAARDAADLRRLLEVGYADGLDAAAWPTGPTFAETARVLQTSFDRPGRGLADAAPDPAGQVRLRALVRRLTGN
jgi:hypothetical protein